MFIKCRFCNVSRQRDIQNFERINVKTATRAIGNFTCFRIFCKTLVLLLIFFGMDLLQTCDSSSRSAKQMKPPIIDESYHVENLRIIAITKKRKYDETKLSNTSILYLCVKKDQRDKQIVKGCYADSERGIGKYNPILNMQSKYFY